LQPQAGDAQTPLKIGPKQLRLQRGTEHRLARPGADTLKFDY
jgi:hypothetical protein